MEKDKIEQLEIKVKELEEKVAKIIVDHVVNGKPVVEYTIGAITE